MQETVRTVGAVGLSLPDAAGRLLAQVVALEADRSRLDGRIVDAYAALHTVLGAVHEQQTRALHPGSPDRPGSPAAAAAGVTQLVLAEVTAATAVPYGQAAGRLRLGTARRRYAGLGPGSRPGPCRCGTPR